MKPTLTDQLRVILLSGAITLAVLAVLWGGIRLARRQPPSPSPTPAARPSPEALEAVPFQTGLETFPLDIPDSTQDTDRDGLPDALETLYKTDALNSDTDGDGYLDGAEVANGHDPTIPSPNDKLTAGDQRSGMRDEGIASPTPAGPTFTEQFINRAGRSPTDTETSALGDAQLNSFIEETNARGYLPTIADSDIRLTSATGRTAIARYLDAISIRQNPQIKEVNTTAITEAFQALVRDGNPEKLSAIIRDLEVNVAVLRDVEVPQEAVLLHKKYLAGAMALLENTKRLGTYQTDYVGALVAASRIEGIRKVFREVTEDIRALEKKYTIE